jgi:hypothetical protein
MWVADSFPAEKKMARVVETLQIICYSWSYRVEENMALHGRSAARDLYRSPSVLTIANSNSLRWTGKVTRPDIISARKSLGKRPPP